MSSWVILLFKDSCSENCVLINFESILEILLRNFAANNGLYMWSTALYEQVHAIFWNCDQYSSPASSAKAVGLCCRQPVIFKKLWVLFFLSGFQWRDFNISLNLWLAENNPAVEHLLMVIHLERVWVHRALELDTEGELNFGLQNFLTRIIPL